MALMLFNAINLLLFLALCLIVGFCYLLAGPSLLAQVTGGEHWFLPINTASGPIPGSEILFLLLVGLLLAFSLQIFSQVFRRQWDLSLLRRGLSLCLGLMLWAVIGYQGWLRQSAAEQQISWLQEQIEALPAQASPVQLEQALAPFFSAQPRLSASSLLPLANQNNGQLRLNQGLAGSSFYEVHTQFKAQKLQSWQIQHTQTLNQQRQCNVIAPVSSAKTTVQTCK